MQCSDLILNASYESEAKETSVASRMGFFAPTVLSEAAARLPFYFLRSTVQEQILTLHFRKLPELKEEKITCYGTYHVHFNSIF